MRNLRSGEGLIRPIQKYKIYEPLKSKLTPTLTPTLYNIL